jgi:TolB-like protein/DNA-binding winged helix-turn-helix (wHTH) protein
VSVKAPTSRQGLRFGVFQVNLSARELRKHGLRVRLPGQSFCILAMLLEKPGEVVAREEMHQRLWPADTFVDFEQGLNTAIKKLRTALADSADNPRYIETLPRVGYRFIAPVEELLPIVQLTADARPDDISPHAEVAAARLKRHRWPAFLAIGVALFAIVGGYLLWPQRHPRAHLAPGRVMLAVLPFENLSKDPEQSYLSDGLTEEMIVQLGRRNPERLGVIARTSVMQYQDNPRPLDQVGRALGVQYVLEGSVQREAGRVRITAELIQVKDQTSVWTREYDRSGSNVLALQDDIAQDIADEIQSVLGGPKPAIPAPRASPSPQSYEAYDAYLKGRYCFQKRTALGFNQSVEYFQKAIALDPAYARAYAGLADSYAMMSSYDLGPQNELIPKAREAALRALRTDDTLAEAHTSLAVIAQNYDWDWETAEKEYRQAIQLDPSYATAHHWYAEFLAFQGRFDEAFAESERARQLDPLSLIIAADHGAILYFSRQYDRAIQQFRTVLEMEPDFPRARLIVFADVQKGRCIQ